jgi:hypothetical protein
VRAPHMVEKARLIGENGPVKRTEERIKLGIENA